MNLLENRLLDLKDKDKKALIPFLMAGDPDLSVTGALMDTLAENGADVLELGVPFSDPLADGPVLQAAADRALASGVTPPDVFSLAAGFSKKYEVPVVLLVYYNLLLKRGLGRFCREAAESGVSALVVPDLPFEEAGELEKVAAACGVINIRFLSLTTSEERIKKICRGARGFIYCVTVTGVTGCREKLAGGIENTVAAARRYTNTPLALGFGISTEQQAREAAKTGDAVIVGSSLVQKIAGVKSEAEKCRAAVEFIKMMKEAMTGGAGDDC